MFVSGTSPLEFTLRMTESLKDIEAMIAETLTTEGAAPDERLGMGEKCLAKDDNAWYRALVTTIQDNGYEVGHMTTACRRTSSTIKIFYNFVFIFEGIM